MKKKIASLIMGLMLLTSTMVAYANEIGYVTSCKECVTLRSAPTVYSAKIVDVPLWSKVESIGWKNGFNQVVYNGRVGWIMTSYLDLSGLEPQVATYPAKVVNCNSYISLRGAANTSANVITTMPLGATVYRTIAANRNGFSLVNYNGQIGWAMSYYLR